MIEGVEELVAFLRTTGRRGQGAMSLALVVGFSAPYAVYVHEDMEAEHKNGQAKFLETPYRLYQRRMQAMIAEDLRAGKTVEEAFTRAGEFLLGEAQKLCPVATGLLKASGFVRIDRT